MVPAFRALLFAGLLLAWSGCISEPSGERAVLQDVPDQDLALLPPDRPVAARVLWHEEPVRTTPLPVDDQFIIENDWPPRDVELTYHGIQPVYDEWGREVAAHIFRYDVMQLVITKVELLGIDTGSITGVRITARYEASPVEFLFDASDARFLGAVQVAVGLRSFDDFRYPNPFAPTYAGLLVPLLQQFLAGDLESPVHDAFGATRLNRSDERPLPGACDPYEFVFEPAPWYRQWVGEPEQDPAEDESREVLCLQDGAPLWVFLGNQTDHLRLERRSPALPTLALQGTPLPPREVPPAPWEPLPMLAGVASPVQAPPSSSPGDWADQVRPVIQGLATSLDYVQWQLDREGLFVSDVSKAFPFFGPGLVPLLGVDPLAFEETSWIWVADGTDAYWGFVDSRYAGPEDPDLHVSQRGAAFDDYPTTQAALVGSGSVQAAWEEHLSTEPDWLNFVTFPDLFGDLPPEYKAFFAPFLNLWSAMEHCFEEASDGRYGTFSALNGQMLSLGRQSSTPDGCSPGSASTSGSQQFAVRLAGQPGLLELQAGHPPVLILTESRQAFVVGAPGWARDLAAALAS